MAWSATADIERCITRTYSRAALGLPTLSAKDRTTSNYQAISLSMANHQLNVACLHSLEIVEVALARCQSCRGTVLERTIAYYGDDR